jgi:cytochrome c
MPAPVAPSADVAAKPAPTQDEVMQLAKKSGCLTCHAIDKKSVGPKWKDVAAKYRGDAGAEARLDEKVLKGGSGVWGSIPMPAHPKLSEADRKTLVKFVLSLE